MKDGRPLRFLGGALGGWVLFRVAVLWPNAETLPLQASMRTVLPPSAAPLLEPAWPKAGDAATMSPGPGAAPAMARAVPRSVPAAPRPPGDRAGPQTIPPLPRAPVAATTAAGLIARRVREAPAAHGPGRLAGSAWMLARGGPSGTLSGGQLGASQAGIRLTYALGHARRVALTIRYATPLSGPGKEAALGVEWKPTRLPFRLIAEQRFVLDGGRGGPTVGIIGGYGPGLVAPGLRVEAYGQAGAIARDGVEGFVDAAARATHPLLDHRRFRIDFGAGIWGSAQRGAARLDIGPTIGVAVPIARRAIRLSADWRERIAGDARPGSGPAFTIGSDF